MFTVSFIGSFFRLQHYASRRHGASFCVSSESRNYLTKSFKAITDLTVLQYYLLFYTVIFMNHSNTPSYYFVSRAERVHSRAGTVTAVQSVCLSGYKSMTACMLHYGFNRSIEWEVGVCAFCLLSHSHIRESTHTQSVSISDSLSLLSPVLLISGRSFVFPPEVSECGLVLRALPFSGCQVSS